MKVDRNIIEQAYAFFHQKLKVYEYSTSEKEMDHIEDSISSYADAMFPALFDVLSGGNKAFLHEHTSFLNDLRLAVTLMEKKLTTNASFWPMRASGFTRSWQGKKAGFGTGGKTRRCSCCRSH